MPAAVPGRRRTPAGGGGTQLYDSVFLGADEIMRKQSGRKALILLSDGEDNGSRTTLMGADRIGAARRHPGVHDPVHRPRDGHRRLPRHGTAWRRHDASRRQKVMQQFAGRHGRPVLRSVANVCRSTRSSRSSRRTCAISTVSDTPRTRRPPAATTASTSPRNRRADRANPRRLLPVVGGGSRRLAPPN